MTATSVTQVAVQRSLRTRRTDWTGIVFQALLLLSLLFSLLVLTTLLADVISRGWVVFVERGTDFLTSGLSSRAEQAGVAPGIFGSLVIAIIVALFAFPIGIATAVYLEEYAPDNFLTRAITINIRNLAGVPSIVYGLLGLTIFVQALGSITGGRSVISGGLTLAVLVLPIVIITSSEALRAVPNALREAGYGVGASRWEVTRHLVLPAAAPGILTGTVLSLSRALGETAPLILVGAILGFFATGSEATLLDQLRSNFTTLPTIVFDWARDFERDFRPLTAAAIVVLLAVTLLANAIAIFLRSRFERTI